MSVGGRGRASKTGGRLSARSGSRRGSELVEGMLIFVPFFALVFLVIDTSFGLFVDATLQYAVQSGVSYAVAGGTSAGGQLAGIQATVASQSLGLLDSAGINVTFFAPTNLRTALANSAGANQAGNIVQVNVSYPFSPLAPLFRSGATINLTASAAAVLTASPAPAL